MRANKSETRHNENRVSTAATAPMRAACCCPIRCFKAERPAEIGSERRSKKPRDRINPKEKKRVLIHPRIPEGTSASLLQICSSNVSSAENTVVAAINRVTTLTQVATSPAGFCEL